MFQASHMLTHFPPQWRWYDCSPWGKWSPEKASALLKFNSLVLSNLSHCPITLFYFLQSLAWKNSGLLMCLLAHCLSHRQHETSPHREQASCGQGLHLSCSHSQSLTDALKKLSEYLWKEWTTGPLNGDSSRVHSDYSFLLPPHFLAQGLAQTQSSVNCLLSEKMNDWMNGKKFQRTQLLSLFLPDSGN